MHDFPVFPRAARVVALSALLGLPLTSGAAGAGELTVFAAASMKTAMDEVEAGWEAATGHELTVSYAGSSALARQIERGAPADVFISANPGWMDHLEAVGRIDPGTRFDLLGNRIVLIAHGQDAGGVSLSAEFDLAAHLGENRLAMALVEAVPAGIYGKAALESLGLWDAVAPKVAQADNVRAALALVATGEAPLGIVYATDARAEDGVSIIASFPADAHPPIVYPAAAVTGADAAPAADFLRYLRGDLARAAFERQGFALATD